MPESKAISQLECCFFRRFVAEEKRERICEQLRSPKRRKKFVQSLCHFDSFDEHWIIKIKPSQQNPEFILKALRENGANDVCHLLSCSQQFDGLILSLESAMDLIVFSNSGTVVICDPETVGYYEGENIKDRYLLIRKT